MAKLPERSESTRIADAIFAAVEANADDWRRVHLGASVIGDTCQRKLWYGFRWATDPGHGGRMLRLFRRGDIEESWIVRDMTSAGMEVTNQTEDGGQYRFTALGGHFGGSIDGAVLGVPGAEKTWHLLEVKTSNDRRFKDLCRYGVQKAQPRHFAQMQVYMAKEAMALSRALYVCVNKNDDSIYTERLHAEQAEADVQMHKAKTVVFAPNPLSRITDDPAWFECKFCEHQPHCQLGEVPKERNCRTCLSSTPMEDGTWTCEHHGKTLTVEDQKAGCDAHRFVPEMVPWQVVEVDDETRTIVYQDHAGAKHRDTGTTFNVVP